MSSPSDLFGAGAPGPKRLRSVGEPEPSERWSNKRVLIVVRTYPVPATKGIEVSCTAAVTPDHQWVRLFPVPYRFLDEDRRFKKYQWIDISVTKARNDPRPESYKLNDQSISIVGSEDSWVARQRVLGPLFAKSLCEIQRTQRAKGSPTLGIFRPKTITRLAMEPTSDEWNAREMAILNRTLLPFQRAPAKQLEKIPFDFKYSFRCEDDGCKGHRLTCTDWEMGQAYRQWRRRYGGRWEQKFRQKFESDMQSKYDTRFFVGTLHQHPNNWIIVGLYYPPPTEPAPLFAGLQ
jgi:hypothetical protein